MSTLQELIEQDFGLTSGGSTKVASEQPKDDQETTQLMAELGLLDEKTASDNQAPQENSNSEKVASQLPVDNIFNEMFPEDADLGVQKTAAEQEQEKVAAYQEAVGARAFDHYASRFDARIEKMAAEQLTGSATISSSTESPEIPDDQKSSDGSAIDTTPKVEDLVSAGNRKGSEEVGTQQQKSASDLAMRKLLLQRSLQS